MDLKFAGNLLLVSNGDLWQAKGDMSMLYDESLLPVMNYPVEFASCRHINVTLLYTQGKMHAQLCGYLVSQNHPSFQTNKMPD